MVEPIAPLVALLKDDPDSAALTSGRIFGGELPASEAAHMPRGAMVIRPAGGGLLGTAYQDWGDVRIDIECFGAVSRDAWQLHLAARGVLKQMRRHVREGVLLHWARVSMAGVLARDPSTDWPVALSSWQVLVSDLEVIP